MYRIISTKLLVKTMQKAVVEEDYNVQHASVGVSGALVLYDGTQLVKAFPPGTWADCERIEPPDQPESPIIQP